MLNRLISSYLFTTQPEYVFNWQGGEPTLMGLCFFRWVVYLQQIHGRNDCRVFNSLQTNGILIDRAFAEHLARHNFLAGLSVDGPADIHDRRRTRADEAGSFADVITAINTFRDRRVEFNVLTSLLGLILDGVRTSCDMQNDCRQYLVVEYNGDVSPCDFFVTADLRLGNIGEESWDALLSSPAYASFGSRKRRWSESCSGCEYLVYCGGDCLKHRFGAGGLSWLCAGWKSFFRHSLPLLTHIAERIGPQRQEEQLIVANKPSEIQRNDPCSCGSYKKLKKCHGSPARR